METWTAMALESAPWAVSLERWPEGFSEQEPCIENISKMQRWNRDIGTKTWELLHRQIHLPAPVDYQVVPLSPSVYKIHFIVNQAAASCFWVWDFCPGVLYRAMVRCGTCCSADVFPCALVQVLRALFHWAVDGEDAPYHIVMIWAQLSGYLKLQCIFCNSKIC